VLDNFSTGNRSNLEGLDVEVVEGELRSYERVHNAVNGTEIVYHLGALGSVPRSVQDPLTSSAVNIEGDAQRPPGRAGRRRTARRLLVELVRCTDRRRRLPVAEGVALDPLSPYGVAKLAAEHYCVAFSRVYHRFEAVVVRYFNVFGPRQSPGSAYAAVIPLFLTAIAEGRPITVNGDGEQRRDFTYVDNVVDGTLRAADTVGVSGRVFNVAASAPASVNELADTIGVILGKEVLRQRCAAARG
jgi:UDP-glucose 4-epimerase